MKRLALLSVLIISAHLTAFSQQAANATLTGTISDPMGAVIARREGHRNSNRYWHQARDGQQRGWSIRLLEYGAGRL